MISASFLPFTERSPTQVSRTPRLVRNHEPNTNSTSTNLPSYIRPIPANIDAVDLAYLTRKSAFDLPSESTRDELLKSYFEFANPFMPLFDRENFLSGIRDPKRKEGDLNNEPRLSILVAQALFFVGSAFVDMDIIYAMGFESRQAARTYLYQRATLLYDFKVEPNPATILQALLLLTYWVEMDDQRGPWHWIHAAISHAQTMDLYGKIVKSSGNNSEIKTLRRLWWCCFMRETIIAVGIRCSTLLRIDEYDITPLNLDDFDFASSQEDQSCGATEKDRILATMTIEMVKLCSCINRSLSARYTTTVICRANTLRSQISEPLTPQGVMTFETKVCATHLSGWLHDLREEARWTRKDEELSTVSDPSLTLHRILLQMTYFTAVNDLYRSQVYPSAEERYLARGINDMVRQQYRKILFRAAERTAALAETVSRHKLTRYMPSSSISVLLPCIVVHVLQIRECPEIAGNKPIQGLICCLRLMEALEEKYSCAKRAMNFLEPGLDAIRRTSPVEFDKDRTHDAELLPRSDPNSSASPYPSENLQEIYDQRAIIQPEATVGQLEKSNDEISASRTIQPNGEIGAGGVSTQLTERVDNSDVNVRQTSMPFQIMDQGSSGTDNHIVCGESFNQAFALSASSFSGCIDESSFLNEAGEGFAEEEDGSVPWIRWLELGDDTLML
ncbi:uncharacterized protein A1O5_01339 [Cladophialophora psammophila CBS 110553]|uniref:Xylanolytic transcriptional activator regulatory domain-containing protein n=1 Tax=Cladophialophora psammophila CBS 110553 TaxID=1182543 RepID=W9XCI0_9EURO|nr:uncharacterized protein A1O5_01339 [Cladophialophora psammophila CBS 110553]EXJ74646.1 hypothetical protein A1O5_01339 [Cladophialophora psammophila CBS 110553]